MKIVLESRHAILSKTMCNYGINYINIMKFFTYIYGREIDIGQKKPESLTNPRGRKVTLWKPTTHIGDP
jgi:hypothetical protein